MGLVEEELSVFKKIYDDIIGVNIEIKKPETTPEVQEEETDNT